MDAKAMLAKAEQFLKAARILLAAEMSDMCAIACYYAVFWAAIATLHYVGIRQHRWKHGELKERFGMECVKRLRLCPEEFGRWIGELYELRNDAMYEPEFITTKVATRAVRKAEQFVQRTKEVCR
ncbi:MAG: HEPN domain-containing protein [Armatimonadota bacterium]